jgi:hypothetical protein
MVDFSQKISNQDKACTASRRRRKFPSRDVMADAHDVVSVGRLALTPPDSTMDSTPCAHSTHPSALLAQFLNPCMMSHMGFAKKRESKRNIADSIGAADNFLFPVRGGAQVILAPSWCCAENGGVVV